MSPAETYLTIKAYKARQDEHYGFLARSYAWLINASGPKKPVKPGDLYVPHLRTGAPRKKPEKLTPAEEAERLERAHEQAARFGPGRRP